jgi:hypothetical protein
MFWGADTNHELTVINRSPSIMRCLLLSLPVSLLVSLLANNLHAQAGVTSPREIPGQNSQDVDVKRTRTPAQQKMDSQLIIAARLKRQGLATTQGDVVHDSRGRAAVDISTEVTDKLLATIRREGGEVVNSYPQFKAVRAYLTLESLETIAGLSEVRMISRAASAELSGTVPTKESPRHKQPKAVEVKQPRTTKVKASGTQSRRKKRRRHTNQHQRVSAVG